MTTRFEFREDLMALYAETYQELYGLEANLERFAELGTDAMEEEIQELFLNGEHEDWEGGFNWEANRNHYNTMAEAGAA